MGEGIKDDSELPKGIQFAVLWHSIYLGLREELPNWHKTINVKFRIGKAIPVLLLSSSVIWDAT